MQPSNDENDDKNGGSTVGEDGDESEDAVAAKRLKQEVEAEVKRNLKKERIFNLHG